MARCVPGPRGCAHSAASTLGWATTGTLNLAHQQRPRRRRRGGDESSRRRRQGGVPSLLWHLGAAKSAVRRPSAEAEKSARRRRRAPADDSSRRPRRALPRAGDGCCRLVVSVTEAEAMAHCWLTTRRHKHCSTAAARTAGVVHRSLYCAHDRQRCTELRANASSTSLAHKACV